MFTFLFKFDKKPIGLSGFKKNFKINKPELIYNYNYKNPISYPMLLK